MSTFTTTPDAAYQPTAGFEDFLNAHLGQEMLRFTTAGSVDDGKSTLIGRLLHDTKSVYEDQLAAVKKSRVNRAANGQVDFSLLTDGLKAEREQGITIDVAYRYFSTSRRKFIIADTPGHEQYTRNMATGASTADVAIILIDAKAFAKAGSLLPQSRRHTYIASLLGIPHIVAAVNKMDLVGYSQPQFHLIRDAFKALASHLGLRSIQVIPVSALEGANVVNPGTQEMPWYSGPTLLDYLETVPLNQTDTSEPMRFPVQLVLRPDASFRGFAGQVARGALRAGDRVMALPSRRETAVSRIVTYDGDLPAAAHPEAVTVELEDEIDLSRGEMLVHAGRVDELPEISNHFRAMVVWMHEDPLVVGRTYIAKHTTRSVRATVRAIRYRVDVNSQQHLDSGSIAMNEIAEVEFETNLPLFFDRYAECRQTGSLILIDPLSNATVGAVMISGALENVAVAMDDTARTSLVLLGARKDVAASLKTALVERGENVVLIDDDLITEAAIPSVVRALELAGAIAISTRTIPQAVLGEIKSFAGVVQAEDEPDLKSILAAVRSSSRI